MVYTEDDIRDLRASGHWPAEDEVAETPQDDRKETPPADSKGKPTDAASVPA